MPIKKSDLAVRLICEYYNDREILFYFISKWLISIKCLILHFEIPKNETNEPQTKKQTPKIYAQVFCRKEYISFIMSVIAIYIRIGKYQKPLKKLKSNLCFPSKALLETIQYYNTVVRRNHNKQKEKENSFRWNLMSYSISEPKNYLYKQWKISVIKELTLILMFFVQGQEPLAAHYHMVIQSWPEYQMWGLRLKSGCIMLLSKMLFRKELWVLLFTRTY